MKKNIIILHWLTVLLIALAFLSIEYRDLLGKDSIFHDVMKSSHLYIGFLILFITILRFIIRQFTYDIELNNSKSRLRKILAQSFHLFLYAWLILIPILGWCIISAKGTYSIPFGLPSILDTMPRVNVIAIKDVHDYFAYVGLGVIFLHASVALIEYYVATKKKI